MRFSWQRCFCCYCLGRDPWRAVLPAQFRLLSWNTRRPLATQWRITAHEELQRRTWNKKRPEGSSILYRRQPAIFYFFIFPFPISHFPSFSNGRCYTGTYQDAWLLLKDIKRMFHGGWVYNPRNLVTIRTHGHLSGPTNPNRPAEALNSDRHCAVPVWLPPRQRYARVRARRLVRVARNDVPAVNQGRQEPKQAQGDVDPKVRRAHPPLECHREKWEKHPDERQQPVSSMHFFLLLFLAYIYIYLAYLAYIHVHQTTPGRIRHQHAAVSRGSRHPPSLLYHSRPTGPS